MVNHFDEQNRRNLGIVWLVVGLIFLFSGFSGGIIFLLLGIVWLFTSDGKGRMLFRSEPENMRTMLKGTTVVLLALALVILIANAIP